jgi:hypothetical protein
MTDALSFRFAGSLIPGIEFSAKESATVEPI